MPVIKQCARCGKGFPVKPSRFSRAKVCGRACRRVAKPRAARRVAPVAPDGFKWCNKGQHFVSLDGFAADAKRRDGKQPRCKGCKAEWQRQNKERISVKRKADYRRRPEEMRARVKRIREAELEKYRELARQSAAKRKDKIAVYRQKWAKENKHRKSYLNALWYQRNRDGILEKQAERYQADPAYAQVQAAKRKAREANAAGAHTADQWRAKLEFWGWRCYLCRTDLKTVTIHLEHRKPLARGGSNWIANIAPACERCNRMKNKKTEKEFREYLGWLASRGAALVAAPESRAFN